MFDKFIDVAKIMRELKAESRTGDSGIDSIRERDEDFYLKEWKWRKEDLLKQRSIIEVHKDIGTRVPQFMAFNKIARKILRFLSKVINKAAFIITRDQNVVNNNLLLSIDRIRESIELLLAKINDTERILNSKIETKHNEWDKDINEKFRHFDEELTDLKNNNKALREEVELLKNQNSSLLANAENINDKQSTLLTNYQLVIEKIESLSNNNKKTVSRVNQRLNKLIYDSIFPVKDDKIDNIALKDMYFNQTYKDFEERFRGSETVIKDRLKTYIEYLKDDKFQVLKKCLDIGCGRGEWLELLQENGYDCIGVDINKEFVNMCKAKGLNVICEDAFDYIKKIENDSLDIITGFHIIEHIEFESLNVLLNEINRVLKPGGLVIFETPNPKNITVGSCNFYLDSTHLRPVHPERIKFQLEYSGFNDIEYIYWQKEKSLTNEKIKTSIQNSELDGNIKDLLLMSNSCLNVPEDYGIIGRKV